MARDENALSTSQTVSGTGSSAASGAVGVVRRGIDEPTVPKGSQTMDQRAKTEKKP